MGTIDGCATTGAQDKVYHTLQIEVDKSIGEAKNIRYTYGEELVDRYVPVRDWVVGPFQNHTAPMVIPEEFIISWETQDGRKHKSNVPVLNKLPSSIKNKTILFVIMSDHIEGFIAVSTPTGPRRTRFY